MSLAFNVVIVLVFFTGAVGIYHLTSGRHLSTRLWLLGQVSLVMGMVLLFLQPVLPALAGVNLANSLLAAGLFMLIASLMRLAGKRPPYDIMAILFGVQLVFTFLFTQISPNTTVRIVFWSVLLGFLCIWTVQKAESLRSQVIHATSIRIFQSMFIMFLAMNGARAIAALCDGTMNNFSGGPVVPAYMIIVQMFVLGVNLSYFLVHNQMLELKIREEQDKLRDLNRNRERILSAMGHDLMGGIGGIQQLAQHLLGAPGTQSPEDIQSMARILGNSSARMIATLKGLMEWSLSLNQTHLEPPIPVSPACLISDTIYMASTEAETKGISLVQTPGTNNCYLLHRESLVTVLRNLLYNAIKFTPAGGTVGVSFDIADNRLILDVADTGKGMSAEQVRLFNSGGVLESTRGLGGEKGYGLGLSLCRELLTKQEGSLCIAESAPGSGTRFRISLPAMEYRTEGDQCCR